MPLGATMMKSVMLPHEQRVIDEKKELDDKITKLDAFIRGQVYDKLDTVEKLRLCRQYDVMKQYSNVLGERIEAFTERKLR